MAIDKPPVVESTHPAGELYAARSDEERAAQAANLARVIAERELAMLNAINNGDVKTSELAAFMHRGGVPE